MGSLRNPQTVWTLLAIVSVWPGSGAGASLEGRSVPSGEHDRPVEPPALPVSFEENRGQTDARVRFLARGPAHSLFLTPSEAVLVFKHGPSSGEELAAAVLRMKLLGANPAARLVGRDELPGRSHYFIGSDASAWRSGIPHFARVEYQEVYPGINLVFYGDGSRLEFDWVVGPERDVAHIQMAFEGAEDVALDAQGNLALRVGAKRIVLSAPRLYQDVDGVRRPVDGRFALAEGRVARFEVDAYDASRPLVIDPVLGFSTYLGGSDVDLGLRMVLDAAGNVYLTGSTASADFPASFLLPPPAANDVFITKLQAGGAALAYSTYLGGSSDDSGSAIEVDAAGNAYVVGNTSSTNFPTVRAFLPSNQGQDDAFALKLDPSGSTLVYSTYLGGSGRDQGTDVAVSPSGEAHVGGNTASPNFPSLNSYRGAGDVFLVKLAANGAPFYGIFIGGSSTDHLGGLALDQQGNTYLTGETLSDDFPAVNALQGSRAGGFDAFVTKLNAAGTAILYSTYLGGAQRDTATAMAVGDDGSAYVTGYTNSTGFPLASPFQPHFAGGLGDVFVTRLHPSGATLSYSTYLGGESLDAGTDIDVDAAGAAVVAGYTSSSNFPQVFSLPPASDDGFDAFVSKLDPSGGTLIYSTYLGGTGDDYAVGVRFHEFGQVYVGGSTTSADFPVEMPLQGDFGGGLADAFVARLSELLVSLELGSPSFTSGDLLVVSVDVGNPGGNAVADFYFGAILPDGDTVIFFSDLNLTTGQGRLSSLATIHPIVPGVDLRGPFRFTDADFFRYRWAGNEPAGSYVFFLAALTAGALDDARLDTPEILALETVGFSFVP